MGNQLNARAHKAAELEAESYDGKGKELLNQRVEVASWEEMVRARAREVSKYKKMCKPEQSTSSTIKEKEIVKEVIIKIRCPYCGNVYNETLDKCPHCSGKR